MRVLVTSATGFIEWAAINPSMAAEHQNRSIGHGAALAGSDYPLVGADSLGERT